MTAWEVARKCSHVIEFKLPVSDSRKLSFRMRLVCFLSPKTLITFRVCFPAFCSSLASFLPEMFHSVHIYIATREATWYAIRKSFELYRVVAAAYCASLAIRSHYMSTCGSTRVPQEYADWKWTAITLKPGRCALCVSQKRSPVTFNIGFRISNCADL